ncbi:hypothetical protein [Conexibacter arvalis]|uniref:Uncharacterized protein n=1 Tax=Conexibacter arvalis TaxID=912552 RepID=A0A840IER0_9ACTN|nr:hypothetical protein [Conexibacter arvalis]MBB4662805.1 hypothetical protein [Conexibacter arvalis]
MAISLHSRRAERALMLLELAREARDALEVADQERHASAAVELLAGNAATTNGWLYAWAAELLVEAIVHSEGVDAAIRVAEDAESRLTKGTHAHERIQRVVLQTEALGEDVRLATWKLLDHAKHLRSAGTSFELERLRTLQRLLAAALRGPRDRRAAHIADFARRELMHLADRLEEHAEHDVALARHWIGVSESVFPTPGLLPFESQRRASEALRWSLEHRYDSARDRLTRGMGAAELLLVEEQRDDAIELFAETVDAFPTVLPRHHRSAERMLSLRGLQAA